MMSWDSPLNNWNNPLVVLHRNLKLTWDCKGKWKLDRIIKELRVPKARCKARQVQNRSHGVFSSIGYSINNRILKACDEERAEEVRAEMEILDFLEMKYGQVSSEARALLNKYTKENRNLLHKYLKKLWAVYRSVNTSFLLVKKIREVDSVEEGKEIFLRVASTTYPDHLRWSDDIAAASKEVMEIMDLLDIKYPMPPKSIRVFFGN